MLRVWTSIFPREQFLILSAEELFSEPARVTNLAYEFLGQAPFRRDSYPIENPSERAPVDPELRRALREFFRPHNRALEEFLGMRFGWQE